MRLRHLIPGALLAALPLTAQANEDCCREMPSWYFGLSGQAVFLKDTDIENNIPFFVSPKDVLGFDTGYGISLFGGYRLLPYLRLELEGTLRRNEVAELNGVKTNADYNPQSSMAFMANIYYDWHNSTLLSPYIGAGAGAVYVKSPVYYTISSGGTVLDTAKLQEWAFGYQLMAGVSYELPNNPDVELLLGYRYVTGQEAETEFDSVPGFPITFTNDSHNVEFGARLFF